MQTKIENMSDSCSLMYDKTCEISVFEISQADCSCAL